LNKVRFLTTKTTHPQQPLFIYLPGMDGSGRLLQKQTKLWQMFNVKCLTLADEYVQNWDNLTNKVIHLINQELKNYQPQQIVICGESFGGCLALKLIAQVPHLFSQLILINPASSFYQRSWLNLGSYVTQILPYSLYANLTFVLLPFLAKLEELEFTERKALLSSMQSIPPQVVSERISLINNFTLEPDSIRSFHKPVSLIASGEDKLLPSVEEVYRLQQLFPQSEVKILPKSGHCCLLEKEVDITKIIDFKKQIPNSLNMSYC